jgi:hypothetical protein
MTDFPYGQIRSHRRNIKRYCRLLATELTDLERQYLHKRIADEHAELQRLEKSRAEQQAGRNHGSDGSGGAHGRPIRAAQARLSLGAVGT